jgi:hypothetical protein
LGQEIWRIDFSGANGPLLLVNKRVSNWKVVAASSSFRSLVYPAAMRQVLSYIYRVEKTCTMDDDEDWRCRWLAFAAALPGVGVPPSDIENDEMWEEWITEAVGSFARQHQMLDFYKAFLVTEASV